MGCIWIYPKTEQVAVQGKEHLTKYAFGRKIVSKAFCKTCGVCMYNAAADLSDEEYNALSDEFKGWVDSTRTLCVLNLRVLNGYDVDEIREKIDKVTGGSEVEPRYVNP